MENMDQPAVLRKRICSICFNNEKNITLTKLNWEKLLKNCKSYLDKSIILNSFDNDTHMSCCSYCYESARQLTNLEEQVKKLQKEISDASLLFSKTVLERRSLVENEIDRSGINLTTQTEKCFTIQKHSDRHSVMILENAILKEEVNEIVSNELSSDFKRKTEKDDLIITDSLFDTDELENNIKDECEIVVLSNEVDLNYFYDENFSTTEVGPVNKDIVQNQQISTAESHGLANNLKDQGLIHSEDKPHKCSVCSKSFSRTSTLKVHEKIHSGEKPHKCSFCSKYFQMISNLKEHQAVHFGERRHSCSFCEKSFKTARILRRHETIHSGERPYNCSFCEKTFLFPVKFKEHERVHTGERPFNCSLCSNAFSSLSLLKRHEKFHTGEKPYKCSFCCKSFCQSSDVKIHERIHTGEKFKCSRCENAYSQKANLTNHIKRIHGENSEEFILP